MMSRQWRMILGVDGGGSSTVACVANDRGEILGRGEAGPSNLKATGATSGFRAIESAIREAQRAAAADEIDLACLGLAGIDHDDDRSRVEEWFLSRRLAHRLKLVNDAELVLAAGTPEGLGVAVIAGTGSITVGRAAGGRLDRAGGWGPIFGDEGSGYGTAVAALRLVAQRFDGRIAGDWRDDPLSIALCRAVGVDEPSGLVNRIYSPEFDRPRIASLASVVVQTAKHDERCDRELLQPAGRALGETVGALARRLGLAGAEIPLALAGGFLLSARSVEDALIASLQAQGYRVSSQRVDDPVVGAVKMAAAMLAQSRSSSSSSSS